MKHLEKVAIEKCNSYEQEKVDRAVVLALDLIDFNFNQFKRGMKVLIKPNVVGSYHKNQYAITTHPAIIEAVCKILKQKGCKIFIGDSPFTNPENAFRHSEIERVAKKYGKLVIFEQDKFVTIKNEHGRILKKFKTARIIKEADLIINMPKLKTHMLTKYTGAIKNLYGCILGGEKQKFHNKARGDKRFSRMLVDIYQAIKPELTIMDAIVGMEGKGPTSGEPKKAGLILASKNGIALDIIALEIIGIKPGQIYAIREAIKRKVSGRFKIRVVGIAKQPLIRFRLPSHIVIKVAHRILKKLFREKPIVVDKMKCIQCGLCARKCPGKAITLKPFPTFDRKKCIRCFCCIEVCPQHALSLKE